MKRWIGAILPAYIGTLGACEIARATEISPHSFLWVLLFLALTLATRGFLRLSDRRLQRMSLFLGFGFSLSMALGYQMQFRQGIGGWPGLTLVLITALGFAPSAGQGVLRLYHACAGLRLLPAGNTSSPRKAFWRYFSLLMLCWFPVFLAYYPGLFAYDAHRQIAQVLEGTYQTQHPLLHTLFLGLFYRLGELFHSPPFGMALHTLCQLALQALAMAYMLSYLRRSGCARAVRLAILGFFALCPLYSMMGISMTKDVLFSVSLVLSLMLMQEACLSPEKLQKKSFVLSLVFSVALACFLRTNGLMVYLLLVPALVLRKSRQQAMRRIAALLLAGIIFFGGGSWILSRVLSTSQPAALREVLSVPLQQVGRVYNLHKDELDCKEEIEEFIPGVYAYVPTFADHIKAFANVGTGNVKEFMELWFQLMKEYPGDYLDAFLFNCQGFWFMDDLSQGNHYGEGTEGRQGYMLSDTKKGFGIEPHSYLPPLEALYEELFSNNRYREIPVIAQLFSLALYSWLLLFLLFVALYERQQNLLLCLGGLMVTLLWLALSPCAIVRYQYPLMLGVPLFFGLIFGTGKAAPKS